MDRGKSLLFNFLSNISKYILICHPQSLSDKYRIRFEIADIIGYPYGADMLHMLNKYVISFINAAQ